MNVSTDNEAEATEVAPRETAEADAVATTVIEVRTIGHQADGSHEDYADLTEVGHEEQDHLEQDDAAGETEDDAVLIAPEFFDAGYVGSGEFGLDEDADVEGTEDAEILIREAATQDTVLAEEPTEGRAGRRAQAAAAEAEALLAAAEVATASVATEPIGARAAARRARQAADAAAKAAQAEPGNRRLGVLGATMVLVLGYQMTPQAVPGGQVGVNAFLGALAMTVWAMRGTGLGVIAKGGRRRAECEGSKEVSRPGSLFLGIGVVLLAFAAFAPDPTNLGDRFAPLAILAGALLVVGVTAEPPGRAAQLIAKAPLRYLGHLSLALLATLAFAFIVVPALTGWSLDVGARIIASFAALGAAALIMRQIDRSNAAQIQRARHRNGHATTVAAALAAVALGATAPGHLNERHNSDDFLAAVEAVPLPAAPDPAAGLPFAKRCWAIPPGFAQATCTFGSDDADVSVALTGDQTAGSWLPALQGLALAKGWRVTTYLAADCMPGASGDAACADWSKRVGKAIAAGDHDLVVVAGDTNAKGGAFGEALRRDGMTVIGMPDLVSPTK